MDKIILPQIAVEGCHGCNPEEKQQAQSFLIRVEMEVDITAAAADDDLLRTIDYGKVYCNIKQLAETAGYNLIETLAERIASLILAETIAAAVIVRVEKSHARCGNEVFPAAVEIERRRI